MTKINDLIYNLLEIDLIRMEQLEILASKLAKYENDMPEKFIKLENKLKKKKEKHDLLFLQCLNISKSS